MIARNKPKTFVGEIDPVKMSDWFRDMEKQFSLFQVSEADKVAIATHYLERDADRWWTTVEPSDKLRRLWLESFQDST